VKALPIPIKEHIGPKSRESSSGKN